MNTTRIFVTLGLIAILAGCGGSSGTMMDDDMAGTDDTSDDGAAAVGVDDNAYREGSAFDDDFETIGPGGNLENRVVYFEFDSREIDSQYRDLIIEHGSYLAGNSGAQVRLEGHADERGSREYNIGLGEGRAQAVRQILLLQGATATQISTVSYGEERPAVLGSDEETWALNRRVELVYIQ
jgi:peptidoglycan-associated lipoprotein